MRGEILFSEPIYGAIYANGEIEWNIIKSFHEGIDIIKNQLNQMVGVAVKNQYYLSNGTFRPARGLKCFISGMTVNRETALNLCQNPDNRHWVLQQKENTIFIYNFKTQMVVQIKGNCHQIP